MAVENKVAEGSISNLLTDSMEPNRSGDALSPEDIAWVDSCLVKDPVISDGDWSSLKDALLEILSLQSESDKSSAPVTHSITGGIDTDMISSGEMVVVKSSGEMDDDSLPMNEVTETTIDAIKEETGILSSEVFKPDLSEASLRNALLPTYNEDDNRVIESADTEPDVSFSLYDMEPSTTDIFKVWDLDIPAEEDELIKQLKKALSESSVPLTPSQNPDSGAFEDLKEDSLDNVISGIADLSLNQHSS